MVLFEGALSILLVSKIVQKRSVYKNALVDFFPHCVCCKIIIDNMAAIIEKGSTESLKPTIHVFGPHCKHHSQSWVIFSNIQIHMLLGICKISVKKTREEHNRKTLKKGAKTKLPTMVSKENGNPHAMRKGIEINERKNCT